jgi:hypothetical protein
MSTRSTIHFKGYGGETTAIIYRHCDGYIAGAGADLLTFLDEIEEAGTAGGSGLASAYVAWALGEDVQAEIMTADPGDIQYRYTVERVEFTACYTVTVRERSLSSDTWKSYELTPELVAEAQAEMDRMAAARS